MQTSPSPEQEPVLAALGRPQTYGPGVDAVERIDTHAAVVFLAGPRAYKVKRAVRLPYLDYATVERRRAALETELALNRAMAPRLYLAVQPVTRAPDGSLRLGGDGPAVDWVLVMRRFEQETLFDRLAQRGALTPRLLTALTDEIVRFHDEAPPRPEHGGRTGIAAILDINERSFAALPPDALDPHTVRALNDASRAALAGVGALLEERRRGGRVRLCHGDLHLRNICFLDGRPTLFDRIEFSDLLACVDVLYDLSFLLMDLDHRGLGAAANLVFNRYLDRRDEADGLPALPLFISMHAAVRAHVGALEAARQADPAPVRRDARAYL
ncbi:MAG: phosphotransferase, partial [Rhodospirillaceae bacterium]|nr:phosphotransferase [Rhodospirillaceae bacterium]